MRIVVTGLLYLVIFASGVWLTKSGKPYSAIILTVHKLISLAAIAYLVVTTVRVNQVAKLSAMEIWAGVITGSFFLVTLATGGLLSTGKPTPSVVLILHRIAPLLTVLSTAATLYLLLGK